MQTHVDRFVFECVLGSYRYLCSCSGERKQSRESRREFRRRARTLRNRLAPHWSGNVTCGRRQVNERRTGELVARKGLSLSDGHLLINMEHLLSICAPTRKKAHQRRDQKRVCDRLSLQLLQRLNPIPSGTTLPAT